MAEGGEYVFAAKLSDLKSSKQMRVILPDRVLALFYVNDKVHAMDHFCYHTGGPLSMGDIEDSHGRTCVVCPWHKHKITLDTGESLYTAIDPSNPRHIKHNCSKGVKQRIHYTHIEGDNVMVKLSKMSKQLDSDRYFSEEYKALIENVLEVPMLVNPNAVNVPLHSSRTNLKK